MATDAVSPSDSLTAARRNRERLAEVRERALRLMQNGATGIQICAALSEGIDQFLLDLMNHVLRGAPAETTDLLQKHAAIIAIGGTGRGDPAPYSDVDLLFLYDGFARAEFEAVTSQFVRDCWDAGISLGHAVRTVGQTIALSRAESEVATALIDMRLLWGSEALCDTLRKEFDRRIIGNRRSAFITSCIASREEERKQHGGSATQLQPDVKKSSGGLRDAHLIRWIGYALYGTSSLDSLRLKGALNKEDARKLRAAHEFLMRVRCELHFFAGKAQDTLTRDEQLRLAEERNIEPPVGQRPVEAFMQTYFRHSTAIAQIVRRFVARHRPVSPLRKLFGLLASRRVNASVKVRPEGIDVSPGELQAACRNLESILRLFRSAAWHGADVSPRVADAVTQAQPELSGEVTEQSASLFLDILKRPGHLGPTLRTMHEAGVLELVIPNMAHARCLLQFNQYHHYTVDEHTLRAIEAVERFEADTGPLGTAYRAVRHKEILHLALLLHDLGKGLEEDHSDLGRAIAETISQRLYLPEHHREMLVFLVYRHLKMSHLAFRRDCSDPDLLMEFAREVGSPETLRMLYVLTAADLSAVGPGVLTDWKTDLLSDLYDRSMVIVSGKPYRHHEEQRLAGVKAEVRRRLKERENGESITDEWVTRQLDGFPPSYLSTTSPGRITDDLHVIRMLGPEDIVVDGWYDTENGTVDFRVVVAATMAEGCFHRITGALTANRLEILEAQICTTAKGTAVDRFRVFDGDYRGPVPAERIEDVAESIRTALMPGSSVAKLFRKFQRYGEDRPMEPVSDQKTRVVIDNDSSETCTVIDVFAHDRKGLLYTLTRTINELGLSVMLAKISTHLDQIVDVFYVTDEHNARIRDGERLKAIRARLLETIDEFERDGYRRFVS